ncbi:hypothetical protein PPTG_20349 [Phytophthora nicotianae INRA-310]|uniref:DUF659 domain-containing protein n=1 Tax=Phytophthora nicotianae (strain INRA-310) TaxID=761204 RepID=W2PAT6_PHYN3|nr:hypothetical protein PPTG_20349 [Phytophthora nicotianae INRA-310]ETM97328.1 hypothetical protein PPTG_20349 [Phytophthora nicotianae INRA-310]
MEGLIVNLSQKEWVIGYAITDGAGQCGRAHRILALRWPNIYFGKCFAHDINNLVKAVLKTLSFCKVADEASSAVNALNASSSKWLPRMELDARLLGFTAPS